MIVFEKFSFQSYGYFKYNPQNSYYRDITYTIISMVPSYYIDQRQISKLAVRVIKGSAWLSFKVFVL